MVLPTRPRVLSKGSKGNKRSKGKSRNAERRPALGYKGGPWVSFFSMGCPRFRCLEPGSWVFFLFFSFRLHRHREAAIPEILSTRTARSAGLKMGAEHTLLVHTKAAAR